MHHHRVWATLLFRFCVFSYSFIFCFSSRHFAQGLSPASTAYGHFLTLVILFCSAYGHLASYHRFRLPPRIVAHHRFQVKPNLYFSRLGHLTVCGFFNYYAEQWIEFEKLTFFQDTHIFDTLS